MATPPPLAIKSFVRVIRSEGGMGEVGKAHNLEWGTREGTGVEWGEGG